MKGLKSLMSQLVSMRLLLPRNKQQKRLKEENKRDLNVSLDPSQFMEKLTKLDIKIAKRTLNQAATELHQSMKKSSQSKKNQNKLCLKQKSLLQKKAQAKRHLALRTVKLRNVKACHVKTILIVQVDVALQQWLMEVQHAMLLSKVVSAHGLLPLKSIMHYTRNTKLISVNIKILLKRLASRNLITQTTCLFTEVKGAAMFMALKISVMDSHAMTMMTVTVVAADILCHFSLKDVSH